MSIIDISGFQTSSDLKRHKKTRVHQVTKNIFFFFYWPKKISSWYDPLEIQTYFFNSWLSTGAGGTGWFRGWGKRRN